MARVTDTMDKGNDKNLMPRIFATKGEPKNANKRSINA